jgi:hypothetical protein
MQLNKGCISQFAVLLYRSSLVDNLPSNSCKTGWSETHSLAKAAFVINGLGVCCAIRAWKSMEQGRIALDARCEWASDSAAHWQTGNSESDATSSIHIRITKHEISDASDRNRGWQMFCALSVQCSEKLTEAVGHVCLFKSQFPFTVTYR